MRRGAAAAILALAALGPLHGQSRFRAGVGAGAGFAYPIGDTRASYAGGPGGKVELALGLAGSAWAVRLEACYLRMAGTTRSGADFPALNMLAFAAAGVRRFGAPGGWLTPYGFAGAGASNLQDALPFAPWRTRLGLHGGAGAELGRGRIRPFLEARITHVTGDPSTDFAAATLGVRWDL